MSLMEDQLEQLDTSGFVAVPSLVSADEAALMEAQVWAWLADRHGIDRNERTTWPASVGKLQPLRRAGVFDGFVSGRTAAIADQLLGAGWHQFATNPQALLSFPTTEAWELPHQVWHFDLPARGSVDRPDALRFLGFVSDVATRGGGTLVVEGSHELVRRLVERSPARDAGQSRDVRRELTRMSPWFAALSRPGSDRVQRFMTDGDVVDGVHVRVVELSGRPGDAVVMHPWMLHNISMNVADRPRMMTSFTLYAAHYQPFEPSNDR